VRLPRDVSGAQLAKALSRYGYTVTRQTGSHLRITTTRGGEHHVTIPARAELRVGTVAAILREVAEHLGMPRQQLIEELFG
jgi:predicted RNA binding protein YcfA (HicA-like mRNA interferase family)